MLTLANLFYPIRRPLCELYRLLVMLFEEQMDEGSMTQPRLGQLGDIATTGSRTTGERNRSLVPVGRIFALLVLVPLAARQAARGPFEPGSVGFHRRGLLRWSSRKGEKPVYGTDSKTSSPFHETGRATIGSERVHNLRGGSFGGGNFCLLRT